MPRWWTKGLRSYDNVIVAQTCNREDVPVTHRGHGDHHPVEGRRDGGEPGVLLYLDKVAETGEDDPAHTDQKDKKKKLLEAVLESIRNRLQVWLNSDSILGPENFSGGSPNVIHLIKYVYQSI